MVNTSVIYFSLLLLFEAKGRKFLFLFNSDSGNHTVSWARSAPSSAATPPSFHYGRENMRIHTSSKLSQTRSNTNYFSSYPTRLNGTIHIVSHQRRGTWGILGENNKESEMMRKEGLIYNMDSLLNHISFTKFDLFTFPERI